MSDSVSVTIHQSQFPEAVRCDLLESLRSRQINHKFHYDSIKQTQRWLALHQAYAPSRTDPECAAMYRQSFAVAARACASHRVHLIGLGCGGGQKDTALLGLLRDSTQELFYTPSDVSVAMVLVARETALQALPRDRCFPLVCDLATARDLRGQLEELVPEPEPRPAAQAFPLKRVFTFFGMLPNFEPEVILPKLAGLLRPGDQLLLSANLAPGSDYGAGVERVLPLYDNELTRNWLLTFLFDLGVERTDGDLSFTIEEQSSPVQLKRIAAYFEFRRNRGLEVDAQRFEFKASDRLRLFFSYRHTPSLVRALLQPYGFDVLQEWSTTSQEEGVFLAAKR